MPCKSIPCIVNSTYILLKPRKDIHSSGAMHETKSKIEQENKTICTKKDDISISASLDNLSCSSYGRNDPEYHSTMTNNSLTFRATKRVFPRPFSTHGPFGTVIEECEPTSSDDLNESSRFSRSVIHNSETPRRHSTSSWPSVAFMKESQRNRDFSTKTCHRRRQSEVITSDSKVFGLVGYRNDSLCILNEQRSENSPKNVSKRENESNRSLSKDSIASFSAMSSVPALEDQRSFRSSPRRYSQPVNSYVYGYRTRDGNGLEKKNSDGSLREYHFDNDTEIQWQKLVARAKTLQLTSPPRKPEIVLSGLTKKDSSAEARLKETETAGGHKLDEVTSIDDNNNRNIQVTVRKRSNERRYSLRMVPTLSSLDEGQLKSNSATVISRVDKDSLHKTVKEQRCVVNPVDTTSRRHSVAVVRPVQQLQERVSGYSTHGALEYAKMLMERIQEEGKTKSKKERLEEMSKVLKLVLEELNRIETPDRDLVSLFISLRAKMVNLRTELKEGESNRETVVDSHTNDSSGLSRSGNDISTHRRFSWI